MKRPLEGHKFFPIVAWSTIIGFALFVAYATHTLTQNTDRFSEHKSRTESALSTDLEQEGFAE